MKKGVFVLSVLVVAVIWGLSFVITDIALEELSVIQIQAVRWTASGLIFLTLILCGKIHIDLGIPERKFILATGAMQPCIYAIFENIGIRDTSASVSALFIALVPVVVMVLGAIFFGLKLSKLTVVSIVVAFAGVAICTVCAPDFSVAGGKGLGYIALIIAVISGSVYDLLSARAAKNYAAIEITAVMALMGAVWFNALNIGMGYGLSTFTACFEHPKVGLACIFLGVLCSTLCYFLYNLILANIENTALVTNINCSSITVVGVIAGILISGDSWGWYTLVGMAMTVGGVWLSSREATE